MWEVCDLADAVLHRAGEESAREWARENWRGCDFDGDARRGERVFVYDALGKHVGYIDPPAELQGAQE